MKMKKIKLFIVPIICAIMMSCNNHGSVENKTDDRFVYNYQGKVIEKYVIGRTNASHYLVIQGLYDTNQVFEWPTNLKNYSNRQIGDTVHFDYIRADRINGNKFF